LEVTHRAIGRHRDPLWRACMIQIIPERILSRQPIVFHADQVGSRPSLLEGFGHHKRDRLAVIRHLRAGEHRMGLMMIARALLRRVSMGEH
jgi:hypothetical protein